MIQTDRVAEYAEDSRGGGNDASAISRKRSCTSCAVPREYRAFYAYGSLTSNPKNAVKYRDFTTVVSHLMTVKFFFIIYSRAEFD